MISLNGIFLLIVVGLTTSVIINITEMEKIVEEKQGDIIILGNFTSISIEYIELIELIELNKTPEFIKNTFPEEYLNLTTIRYFDNECLEWFCPTGDFNEKNHEIRIAVDNKEEEVKFAVVHEIGHLLFHVYTNTDISEEWHEIWSNTTAITEYGTTHFKEDFAEYYTIFNGIESNYGNHKAKNERLDRKDQIIETLLEEFLVFDLR